jgi:hypothetical protein
MALRPPPAPRRPPPRPQRPPPPLPLRRAPPPLCPLLRLLSSVGPLQSPALGGLESFCGQLGGPAVTATAPLLPRCCGQPTRPGGAGPPPAKSKPSSCRVLTFVVGHCSISLPKTKDDGWHKVESRALVVDASLSPMPSVGVSRKTFGANASIASPSITVMLHVATLPAASAVLSPSTARMPARGSSQRRGCSVPPPGSGGWFGARLLPRPRWLPLLPLELTAGTPRLHGGVPGVDVSGAWRLLRTLPPHRRCGEGNRPSLFRRFCQRRGLPMLGPSMSLIVRLPLTRRKLPSVVLSSPLLVELTPWSPLIKCGKPSHRIST